MITLKKVKISGQTDANGDVTIDIAVPADIDSTPLKTTRFVKGGYGWFENPSAGGGDWFEMMVVSNNAAIAPVGTVLGTYVDTDMPAGNQGFFIPPSGVVYISSPKELTDLKYGTAIRLIAHRSDGAQGEWFRGNVEWVKDE